MAKVPLKDGIPRFEGNEDRMDRFVNGGPSESWETTGGVVVPSLQKFLTTALVSKADSADVDALALEVSEKAGREDLVELQQSNENVNKRVDDVESRTGSLDAVEGNSEVPFAFTDTDNKVLMNFNGRGEMDNVRPAPGVKANFNYAQAREDVPGYAAVWLNENGTEVLAALPLGFVGDASGSGPTPDPDPEPVNGTAWPMIRKSPVEISVLSFDLIKENLPISVLAEGRSNQNPIQVNGDGLCHPKVVYVPGGWNGYKYWMAFTPYFGVIGEGGTRDGYENPHVVATNDWETWVEPTGARLDGPTGNSFLSDTHMVLGDDGFMHLWYRDVNVQGGTYFLWYRKSRDGLNWSPRIDVKATGTGDTNNQHTPLSPAIHRVGAGWAWYDCIKATGSLPIPAQTGSSRIHAVRRSGRFVDGDFGPYDVSQVVNYLPRRWPVESDPWHMDAIEVSGLYLHLVNDRSNGSADNYLAYSSDGWNFTVLPKLALPGKSYRSCIHVEYVEGNAITLGVVIGFLTGRFSYYTMQIEVAQ